ncbi:Histone deacetylase HD type 1 [Abortiporus biennis]
MESPAQTTIFLQETCLKHQFIRSKDTSNIVERPERLRAINVGISAALSRLETARTNRESLSPTPVKGESPQESKHLDELTAVFNKLKIVHSHESSPSPRSHPRANIVKSSASIDILNNPAVKFVHGDIDGDVYLENLIKWSKESRDNIANRGSEIPECYNQGDLYLCPTSVEAIQGALGTVCEAVDTVLTATASDGSPPHRAFVAIRPPGHHCGEDTPSGFCFVNNVSVAAAHAHLNHNINRVVILDIDLHHGNGTQSIAWQINEETYRVHLEQEAGAPPTTKPGPQIYYGSMHDILSYPCEDGKLELIQAASVSIHGPHGQYIENIHLHRYHSEEQFWKELYDAKYMRLLNKAEEFLKQTGGGGDDVMIFISAGFDASEHEYESMSRHQRKVPTSFYHRFTRDACALANKYSKGRLISVLEGGYSDRALTSGAMAHVIGLVAESQDTTSHEDDLKVDPEWWSVENLELLEQATKKRRGGRQSHTLPPLTTHQWLHRALEIFSSIDSNPPTAKAVIPPSTMSLRDRSKPSSKATSPERQPPLKTNHAHTHTKGRKSGAHSHSSGSNTSSEMPSSTSSDSLTSAKEDGKENLNEEAGGQHKKLPRVILKLGPDPNASR